MYTNECFDFLKTGMGVFINLAQKELQSIAIRLVQRVLFFNQVSEKCREKKIVSVKIFSLLGKLSHDIIFYNLKT